MTNTFNGGNDGTFDKDEMAFDMIIQLASEAKQNLKTMKEMQLEMRKSEQKVLKVGEFMAEFYNEYREHDCLTTAQCKELKEAQHKATSTITKILNPRLDESSRRGSDYLKQWIKVNKGIWSIYKTNVNGVSIPFDRTPKIKYSQALEYVKDLTVADYLAYRDGRWSDIKKFEFIEVVGEEKMTIDKIINIKNGNSHEDDEGNSSPMMLH